MKINQKVLFYAAVAMTGLFFLFTILVKVVDVQAIGPNGSEVGFATMNAAFFSGKHTWLEIISKIFGILAILTAALMAVLGVVELILRKSVLKVDSPVLVLGALYIVTILFYVFFNFVAVNYRPVPEANGELEASYPSSHTVLAVVVFATAPLVVKRLLSPWPGAKYLGLGFYGLAVLTVVTRMFSGVHWLSDIIGGLFLSAALILWYYVALNYWKGLKRAIRRKQMLSQEEED